MKKISLILIVAAILACPAAAERIKDIVDIKGVRGNPLLGYGLVIGLNGTGDNSPASRRALTNILRRTGIVLNPDDLASKNIASVMVTAELPAFGGAGTQIDVTVSAVGSATSLQGGTLLMTSLVGADLQTYAVAQGAVSLGGGFSASGEKASVTKNHPTAGMIPNGATIEKEELATFVENGRLTLLLKNPDFTTAENITQAINGLYPRNCVTIDGGTVKVDVPPKLSRAELVGFIQKICNLETKVDHAALVLINERTGTVIVGENVMISTVAISHGNLSIVKQEKDYVKQPEGFSNTGKTEKEHRTEIKATEDGGGLMVVGQQVSVNDLAKALNAMGLTPRDLIAIFTALKRQGALQADLQIM